MSNTNKQHESLRKNQKKQFRVGHRSLLNNDDLDDQYVDDQHEFDKRYSSPTNQYLHQSRPHAPSTLLAYFPKSESRRNRNGQGNHNQQNKIPDTRARARATNVPGRSETTFLESDRIKVPESGRTKDPINGGTKASEYDRTKVHESGRTKVPESSRTKDPVNVGTKAPEYGRTKVLEYRGSKIPESGRTKVPEYIGSKDPENGGTKVPESHGIKVPASVKTKVAKYIGTKVTESDKAKDPENGGTKVLENRGTKVSDNGGTKVSVHGATKVSVHGATKVPCSRETKVPESCRTKVQEFRGTKPPNFGRSKVSKTYGTKVPAEYDRTNFPAKYDRTKVPVEYDRTKVLAKYDRTKVPAEYGGTEVSKNDAIKVPKTHGTKVPENDATKITCSRAMKVIESVKTKVSKNAGVKVPDYGEAKVFKNAGTEALEFRRTDVLESGRTKVSKSYGIKVPVNSENKVPENGEIKLPLCGVAKVPCSRGPKFPESSRTKVYKSYRNKDPQHDTNVETKVPENDGTKVLETGRSKVTKSCGTKVSENSGTKVLESRRTKVLESDRTKVSKSYGTEVVKSYGTKIPDSRGTKVLENGVIKVSENGTGTAKLPEYDGAKIPNSRGTKVYKSYGTKVPESEVTKISQRHIQRVQGNVKSSTEVPWKYRNRPPRQGPGLIQGSNTNSQQSHVSQASHVKLDPKTTVSSTSCIKKFNGIQDKPSRGGQTGEQAKRGTEFHNQGISIIHDKKSNEGQIRHQEPQDEGINHFAPIAQGQRPRSRNRRFARKRYQNAPIKKENNDGENAINKSKEEKSIPNVAALPELKKVEVQVRIIKRPAAGFNKTVVTKTTPANTSNGSNPTKPKPPICKTKITEPHNKPIVEKPKPHSGKAKGSAKKFSQSYEKNNPRLQRKGPSQTLSDLNSCRSHNNDLPNHAEEAKEHSVKKTKVVFRLLPPDITKLEFLKTVERLEPLPPYDYFSLFESHQFEDKYPVATAWVNFLHESDALKFCQKHKRILFHERRSKAPYMSQITFASHQYAFKRARKPNYKKGTLEKSKHFKEFLKKFKEKEELESISLDQMAEEIEIKEAEAEVIKAPLVEYLLESENQLDPSLLLPLHQLV